LSARPIAALLAVAALSASPAQADICLQRPPIEPGADCNCDTAPEVGFWDGAYWVTRAVFPNTCNPTSLRGVPPQAVIATGPRTPATEKRIVLFGDLMAAPEERVPAVDQALRTIFQRADLIVGNVEAPLVARTCRNEEYDPSATGGDGFAMSRSHFLTLLHQYGIAPEKLVITLANNHSGDRGDGGVAESRAVAQSLIQQVGLRGVVGLRGTGTSPQLSVHDFGALRVGVAGWSETDNCQLADGSGRNPWLGASDITGTCAPDWRSVKAAQGIDLLLGSVHWGQDFYTFPDAATRQRAAVLDAAGFDLIAAHHPHVLQPAESLSPGNMVFYSLASLNLNWAVKDHTVVPVVEVVVDAQGAIVEYTLHPFVYAKRAGLVACRPTCGPTSDLCVLDPESEPACILNCRGVTAAADTPWSVSFDAQDLCSTEWSVIPMANVTNSYTRTTLQNEVRRVFPSP
jgi:Bacterial capsule synthesis protein PGA_cap